MAEHSGEKVTLAVSGSGRSFHLADVVEMGFSSSSLQANTLCGRTMWDIYEYPADQEQHMPWPICKQCERERTARGDDR